MTEGELLKALPGVQWERCGSDPLASRGMSNFGRPCIDSTRVMNKGKIFMDEAGCMLFGRLYSDGNELMLGGRFQINTVQGNCRVP